ncbi:MAG: hypothetical protein H6633_28290 [Anaerolineales bacterium]|nr:hypothetical protein [Anaerolineales bacterium]
MTNPPKPSNYEIFRQADFNRPDHYPLNQPVSAELYRPLAAWMGRLILPKPEERETVKGAWFELHHAGPATTIWSARFSICAGTTWRR